MGWRRKPRLTEESFAHDPLAHRIFVRSQQEHHRREVSDAIWETVWRNSTLRGYIIAGIPPVLVLAFIWGIVAALYDESVEQIRAFRDRVRKRRWRRLVRRARGTTYSIR